MKSLKAACKEAYDKLEELDELIRPYAETKLKPEDAIEFELIEETLESLSFASGRMLILSGGLEDDD